MKYDELTEAIDKESDLILKLTPISETDIFKFMDALSGGTFFNMGMYSSIPVSKAYKPTIRIYKVIEMTSIVSGVNYENIKTTKDFRADTGTTRSSTWYDHMSGYENKVGVKKSDANAKYVLWDIKAGSGTNVRYYVVDIATGSVVPVTKAAVLASDYLTASEKAKLTPKPVTAFNLTTGELVTNDTVWRTAAFEHIFWLSQNGKATTEVGSRFTEDFNQSADTELFVDGNPQAETDLDSLLSGETDFEDPFSTNFPEF